jgi:hypothetical protein
MSTQVAVTHQSVRRRSAVAPKKGRARVTNGSCVHVGGNPRGTIARRYNDLLDAYRDKLGHEPDLVEDTMCRQAASLALQHELMARALASGKRINPADLTQLSSELRRALIRLGLGGVSTKHQGPRLSDLLAEHSE